MWLVFGDGVQLCGHFVESIAGLVHLLGELANDLVQWDASLVHDGHNVDDAVSCLWASNPVS